jgi:hypothetical protein
MTKRIVYENLEPGLHISVAAKAALQHFSTSRVAIMGMDVSPSIEQVFIFNDTSVNAECHDSVETLTQRWFDTHEANRQKAAFRRRVLEANPDLEELMSMLGLTTAIGLGNTLDWIAKFASIADESVVEAFGKEVLGEFENRGYTANEPLPGSAVEQREALYSDKAVYGRYIVGLFLFELSKGRAIERRFEEAVIQYDSMCLLSH